MRGLGVQYCYKNRIWSISYIHKFWILPFAPPGPNYHICVHVHAHQVFIGYLVIKCLVSSGLVYSNSMTFIIVMLYICFVANNTAVPLLRQLLLLFMGLKRQLLLLFMGLNISNTITWPFSPKSVIYDLIVWMTLNLDSVLPCNDVHVYYKITNTYIWIFISSVFINHRYLCFINLCDDGI